MQRIYHVIYLLLLMFTGSNSLLAAQEPMSLEEAARVILDESVTAEIEPYVVYDTQNKQTFAYLKFGQGSKKLLRFELSVIVLGEEAKERYFCDYWGEFTSTIESDFEIIKVSILNFEEAESEWQLFDSIYSMVPHLFGANVRVHKPSDFFAADKRENKSEYQSLQEKHGKKLEIFSMHKLACYLFLEKIGEIEKTLQGGLVRSRGFSNITDQVQSLKIAKEIFLEDSQKAWSVQIVDSESKVH